MILALNLKNFTIIEDLSVSLNPGLNIITGETGAGKSVIVDAINIILGDKASSENIKSGKNEAHIEALFDITKDEALKERLSDAGFETSSGELLLKRVIYRNSRSKVFINGSLSTLSLMSTITQGLVDIFSQHEHQSLMKEENHVKILDDYGQFGNETSKLKDLYQQYLSIKNELNDLIQTQKDKFEKEDYLKFQLQEINNAELVIGEDQKLEEERLILANQEKLRSTTSEAYETLYENENSVLGTLKRIFEDLKAVGKYDQVLEKIGSDIEKNMLELEETSFSIREYGSDMNSDSLALETVQERIQLINGLKRKYGEDISEILEKRDEIEKEINNIEHYDELVQELTDKSEQQLSNLLKLAGILSKKRKKLWSVTTRIRPALKKVMAIISKIFMS